MIVGLGIDVCSVERVRRSLRRFGPRFMRRILTAEEFAYCVAWRDPAEPFAARFAAKEAALKALGVPRGLKWQQMQVLRSERGAPSLHLSGAAAEAAEAMGVHRALLSLTHDAGVAAAVVVLEG